MARIKLTDNLATLTEKEWQDLSRNTVSKRITYVLKKIEKRA